jgi:hypothetical protein
MRQQVKLYVKGAKKAMGAMEEGHYTRETTHVYPMRYWHGYKVEQRTVYEYVLPDYQKEVVELLEEIAPKYGFEVAVIDLSRINRFGRAFSKEFKALKVFPTLKTSSGKTLTTFTKQDVETFLLSETAATRCE